ncbi:hemolysin-III related-domain-containing protein [Chytridium lagenaria]|nr:hemolysin-III related-domain-containing protein [Chytridium lagenaria]
MPDSLDPNPSPDSTLTQRRRKSSSASVKELHPPLVEQHKYDGPINRQEALKQDPAFMDKTVSINQMPSWYHDNVFINSGYRKIQYTYRGCIRSLFYLHNETGNVYSHLIGSLLFLALIPVTAWLPVLETTTAMDTFCYWGVYDVGDCVMDVSKAWNKADYMGIVVLIVGSFVPSIYYGFYCTPHLQHLYTISITLFGTVTALVTMSKRFSTPQYRYLRTLLFVVLGVSAVVPLGHMCLVFGVEWARRGMSLVCLVVMGIMYVVGAGIYASRIPERWFPGMFDIWGHSHQIFHILVVTAAITHYIGVLNAYKFWHETNHMCQHDVHALAADLASVGWKISESVLVNGFNGTKV